MIMVVVGHSNMLESSIEVPTLVGADLKVVNLSQAKACYYFFVPFRGEECFGLLFS